MDERTKEAVDAATTAELLGNGRIITHPKYGKVRLARPTPRQEALIGEARRNQYQTDLFGDEVKAKKELLDKAISRGIWTVENDRRIEELMAELGQMMGVLDSIGFKSLDQLLSDHGARVTDLLDLYPDAEQEEVRGAIRAYANIDSEPTTALRDEILDAATTTTVDDLLDEIDALRVQIEVLKNMGAKRKELDQLTEDKTRLLIDSLEARADRAQELARLFHCATNAETKQPLWPSLEVLKDAEPEDLEFLVMEMTYFLHGVQADFRESLQKYGFTPRLNGTSGSSADSLAQPTPNSDGESVESAPTLSSAPTE